MTTNLRLCDDLTPREAGDVLIFPNVSFHAFYPGDDGGWFGAYQKVLRAAPEKQWANDEEEFGICFVTDREISWHPIPKIFPIEANGANLAKREILRCGKSGKKRVFIVIQEPFSRHGKWGDKEWSYSFNLSSHWWLAGKGWGKKQFLSELPRLPRSPENFDAAQKSIWTRREQEKGSAENPRAVEGAWALGRRRAMQFHYPRQWIITR